ncbi:putative ankyrin repeat-containing domain-containing protein [Helianthus debilis subsp. tardiflorus]
MLWTTIMKMSTYEVDKILRGPPDSEPKDKRNYSSRVLFIAAEMGNTKFIVEILRLYPDLIWKANDNRQSIFHVAVSHRQEGVYNLLYETGMMDLITTGIDVDGNTMLHLAAMHINNKRLQEISGVALQMQRELLWYKLCGGGRGGRPLELFTQWWRVCSFRIEIFGYIHF